MAKARRQVKTIVTRAGEKVKAYKTKKRLSKKVLKSDTDFERYFTRAIEPEFKRTLEHQRVKGKDRFILRVRTVYKFGRKKVPAYFGIPRARLKSKKAKRLYLEEFKMAFKKAMQRYLSRELSSVAITGIETEVLGVPTKTPLKRGGKAKPVRRRRHRSKKVGRVSSRRRLRRPKRKNVSKSKKVSRLPIKKLRRL